MDDLRLLTSVYQVLSWPDCLSDLLGVLCESDLPFSPQPQPQPQPSTTAIEGGEWEKENGLMEVESSHSSEQNAFSLPLFLEEVLKLCLHTCSSSSLRSIAHYLFTLLDDPFCLSSSSSSSSSLSLIWQGRLTVAERILAVVDPDLREGVQRVKEVEKQVGIRLETRFARATVMEVDQLLHEVVNGNGYDVRKWV